MSSLENQFRKMKESTAVVKSTVYDSVFRTQCIAHVREKPTKPQSIPTVIKLNDQGQQYGL